MVEQPNDRFGGIGHLIHGQELAAWDTLIMRLRISDSWNSPFYNTINNTLSFSRAEEQHSKASPFRIDRIYTTDLLQKMGGSTMIILGTSCSDQSPVLLSIGECRALGNPFLNILETILLK